TTSGNPELHSGIPCSVAPGSLLHLPCPALPRSLPCSVPGNVLWPMPAFVFRVPFLRRRDVRGTELAGNFKIVKGTISHTFCPECFVRRPACIFTVLS
ncbi:unnamed protein product, partial [Staurois parvus]